MSSLFNVFLFIGLIAASLSSVRINDKGEFDTEKSTEVIKMFLADEEAQNKAIEAIKICSSVNEQSVSDDEGCERAVLLIKCLEPFKDQVKHLNIVEGFHLF
ncbi:unnamed protein product [Parnassius apollo]|uniref:(apollo) hypothetical protein n=1 Tax=Parnassius apollo TaxID=110799 RepID=A0A8S3X718_PARAO|nr:unnamed protein product [Parnassius apollo]